MLQAALFSIIVFGIIISMYRYIGHKRKKTDSDITIRRILIELFSYSLIVALCAFLMTAHWQGYIRIWGDLGGVNDFVTLVELIVIALYFLMKPIRKAMETVYTKDDIKNVKTCSLYLRSFNTDKLRGEKNICKVFNKYCPTLSIGNPNTILPFTHSKRIYVTDEHWKSVVEELMQKARVILLRVGDSEGTKWEISKVFSVNHLRKAIFLIYSKEDHKLLKQFLASCNYELPSLDVYTNNIEKAYFLNSDGTAWNVCLIHTKNDIRHLLSVFKSQRKEISNEKRITLTGKKYSFWTHFRGTGELPYYRIRVIVYYFSAYLIAIAFGKYGIKVFNSNQYALYESDLGWVKVDSAKIIDSGEHIVSEKLRKYSISPDYKSVALNWDNGTITYFDLISENTDYSFLFLDNPKAIGYTYDGSLCLAIQDSMLLIGHDTVVEGLDGHMYKKTAIIRSVAGFGDYEGREHLMLIDKFLTAYDYSNSLIIKNIENQSISTPIVGEFLDRVGYCRTNEKGAILISPEEKDIYLYDMNDGSQKRVIHSACPCTKQIFTNAQTNLYATVGGGFIPSGKRRFVIDLYDQNFEKIHSYIGHGWTVTSVAFSPDGTRMVSMSHDNTVRVWDTHTGKELCRILVENSYSDTDFAVFAGNGKKVLLYVDESLYLYNLTE